MQNVLGLWLHRHIRSRYNCLLFIIPCVPGIKMYISLSPYLYVYYEANKMESNQAQRYIWTWFYKTVQIIIILSFQKWKINFVIGICLIHKITFSYLDIFHCLELFFFSEPYKYGKPVFFLLTIRFQTRYPTYGLNPIFYIL